MKILWSQNLVFIPILSSNKYLSASISGIILNHEQFTEEEIRSKYPQIVEAKDFHDLCKQWGNKD